MLNLPSVPKRAPTPPKEPPKTPAVARLLTVYFMDETDALPISKLVELLDGQSTAIPAMGRITNKIGLHRNEANELVVCGENLVLCLQALPADERQKLCEEVGLDDQDALDALLERLPSVGDYPAVG